MKKISLIISSLLMFCVAFAEEGMLIPSVITAFESDMQARGMKLSAKDIYDVNHSSMKDAILHFGGGCTAELVSSKGLLLTNHHCGYSYIQSHSSLDKDYLKNGFWAKSLEEELPNPGLTVSRMVRIEDVTEAVLFGVTAENQQELIKKHVEQLIKDFTLGTKYEAEIKPFDYGNHYYIIVKEVFSDVRLVGTPPNSIGKFGGDTDNWVWPRHTGDFSVFRVYAGAGNQPASFSKENMPYAPIHFLPISFKDRKVGDFTMVYGFPGETEQHVVSGYLQFIINKERPARIKMREQSLAIIDKAMREADITRIQYAAKQASIANAYKKWIGQIDGLKRLNGVGVKQSYEENYTQTALTKIEWKKYAGLVDKMNELVASGSKHEFGYAIGVEYLFVGPEFYKLCKGIDDLVKNGEQYATKGELQAVKDKMIKSAEGFFKNYDAAVDRKIFESLTALYLNYKENSELSSQVGAIDKQAAAIYTKSILTDLTRYKAFVSKFVPVKSNKKLSKDPGYALYTTFITDFRTQVLPAYQLFDDQLAQLLKVYVEGKYTMFPNEKHWSDANSTLRITYGQLEGSTPTDGMTYTEHTTLDGVVAKYNTGNPDFELLPRMLELHSKKQYGPYAQNGELWVCFTGSNHTTGGNSGSPVIDANGHLMGLNFDRTWESTMSDYMFDPSRCRNVVVDIRYVLWVMDTYSGAKHLVDEMVLMK